MGRQLKPVTGRLLQTERMDYKQRRITTDSCLPIGVTVF